MRSDVLVGTASVKLQVRFSIKHYLRFQLVYVKIIFQPLETTCELHDTFSLMEGRRAVGGKVEVKIRIRNPILTKQVEKVEEKWLVIKFQ